MNRGIFLALGAYIFWGLHPIYWKQLSHVSPYEIVSHRIIWSLLFFIIVISCRKQWPALKDKLSQSNNKALLFFPALLIGSNWFVYIWAVTSDFIIETSLGYFISPLLSVLLGVFILKERLRIFQWLAIAVATVGVLIMTFFYGHFPWIALYLAGTWALYGLMRKKSPLNPVQGLTLETMFLMLLAICYLFYLGTNNENSFLADTNTSLLLVGTGIISGFPLINFIAGARMINLSLIGVLQYIYPTLIFLSGYVIYNEPFTEEKIIGFSIIWVALIIYSIEGFIYINRKK